MTGGEGRMAGPKQTLNSEGIHPPNDRGFVLNSSFIVIPQDRVGISLSRSWAQHSFGFGP